MVRALHMAGSMPLSATLAAMHATSTGAFVAPALRPAHVPEASSSASEAGVRSGSEAPPAQAATAANAAGLALSGAVLATGCAAIKALGRPRATRRSVAQQGRLVRAAAPSSKAPLPFDPAAQVGAVAPLGYFDPLGFCKVGEEQDFRILREAELKHGRVAMMASIGLVGQHFLRLPGAESLPTGAGALNTLAGQVGFFAIFVWGGVLEQVWKQSPDQEVGNFGDPFGLGMYDVDMRNRELNNGRFAMVCVAGIVAAELTTGKDAIQQFGF
mmetsp:Transcript_87873/g.273032  ORF Transcript_87873/g.273032 Transcript_87873/m.273032 type:complete len:271 (+) Transcript_87873:108-920(+)